MAVTDLADNAAAVAAGYTRTQTDRGVGKSPRYLSGYSKPIVEEAGASGGLLRSDGNSDFSQAAADTQALNALNVQRRHRYGGSPGRASGDANSVGTLGGSMATDQ